MHETKRKKKIAERTRLCAQSISAAYRDVAVASQANLEQRWREDHDQLTGSTNSGLYKFPHHFCLSFPKKRICAEKAQSLNADFTDDNGVDDDVDDYDDDNGDGVGFKRDNLFFCIQNVINMGFFA